MPRIMRPMMACAIAGFGAALGCKSADTCKSQPPSFQLDLAADPSIAMSAQSLTVTLQIGSDHWRNTYNVTKELQGGSTSIAVTLDNPAPTMGFEADITVLAFDMPSGSGNMLGGGAQAFQASPDGCNHFSLNLKPGPVTPPDGGVTDSGQTGPTDGPVDDRGRPHDGGPGGGDGGADAGVPFGYPPSNFVPGSIGMIGGAVDLTCAMAMVDTDNLDFTTGWCGQPAPSISMAQQQSPAALIFSMTDFHVGPNTILRVVGSKAAIFATFGNANIEGTIDASGADMTPGAGGSNGNACMSSTGGSGGITGGGGGGYGTAGAQGGGDGQGNNGGSGGAASTGGTDSTLVPLRGGCSGGHGGDRGYGGPGGGGLQLSAALTLNVTGRVFSGGAGGGGGDRGQNGGGGGGSGGGILLEANDLEIAASASIDANGGGGGGGGGEGGGGGGLGARGQPGQLTGGTGGSAGNSGGLGGRGGAEGAAPGPGDPGSGGNGGGGGGGGSVGRVRFNGAAHCHVAGNLSPIPSRGLMCN